LTTIGAAAATAHRRHHHHHHHHATPGMRFAEARSGSTAAAGAATHAAGDPSAYENGEKPGPCWVVGESVDCCPKGKRQNRVSPVSPSVPKCPLFPFRFPSASLPLPLHLFSFPSKKLRRFAKNSDSVSVELHPSPFPFPQYTQPKAGSRRARSRTASTGKGTARRCSGATARRRPSTRCSA
jgi:hypothetical protein